ncbi:MAG: helix-turn-helix transcriptional regulator [Bacteroidaceae bacterium]|nr:helix-turn-helix transcriptional regulator [Bacteroidaceae bacterium]
MYSLKEAWIKISGTVPFDGWNGRMYCVQTDAALTFRTNMTQGFLLAYTFTLVLEGQLTINYNGREITLNQDTLYIYSPGMQVTILSASENYRGICLLVDEHQALDTDTVRNMIRIAYLPVIRLSEPVIAIPKDLAVRLANRMEEFIYYLKSDNGNKEIIMQHLYALFLLDLQSALNPTAPTESLHKRTEEIFIGFIRMLPQNFVRHHDIGFYAGLLNVSTTYLSRVVRQISGRTVIDYVNQYLIIEATFLLRTSKLSIAEISDRLNFSDQAAFSRFFYRLRGVSPKQYRRQ